MPIMPSSGQVSMSDVKGALGYSGSAQLNLNDADVRALFNKSTGAIKLTDGYGNGARLNPATVVGGVETSGSSIIEITTFEGDASEILAGVRVRSNGTIEAINGLTSAKNYTRFNAATDWILPNSAGGGAYTVRCTKTGGIGSMDGDALDTDHALSSDREFYIPCPGQSGGNSATRDAQGTLTIKGPGGGVIAEIDFDFTADNDRT